MSTQSMLHGLPPYAFPAVFALVAACGGGETAPTSDSDAPAELSGAAELTRGEARDAAATREFRLTMDRVRGYATATENLYVRAAADPAFRARLEAAGEADAEQLDDVIRVIEGTPEWRREIERAGISIREYVMVMTSLTAVGVHVMLREMGQDPEPTEWLSEQNLAFFEENRSEIEGIMQRLQELEPDDDDSDW